MAFAEGMRMVNDDYIEVVGVVWRPKMRGFEWEVLWLDRDSDAPMMEVGEGYIQEAE